MTNSRLKDKKLINPKLLDFFDCEWWLSKTRDEDTNKWSYCFQLEGEIHTLDADSAHELAKMIGKLIEKRESKRKL